MDNPDTLSTAATWFFTLLIILALTCMLGYTLWFIRMRHVKHFLKPRLEPSRWTILDMGAVFFLFLAAMLSVGPLRESLCSLSHWNEDMAMIAAGLIFQLVLLSGLLAIIFHRRKVSIVACPSGTGHDSPSHWPGDPKPKNHIGRMVFAAVTFQLAIWPLILLAGQLNTWLMDLSGQKPVFQKMVEILLSTESQTVVVTLLLMAVILAPVVEELVFRCFLYRWLKSHIPWPAAMALSSLSFALAHDAAFFNVLPLTLLGCGFVMIYEHQRTLWAPIFMHATFNLLQCTYLLSLRG